MTGKVKAVTSGWAEVVAEELFPGVGAGSCLGNPVPVPNGPMTSSVGKKERLKMMRAEQRIGKRRTIYSLQLSRAPFSPRGQRRCWWGAKQRSLKKIRKPHPTPPATQNSTTAECIPGAVPVDRTLATESMFRPSFWAKHTNALGSNWFSFFGVWVGAGLGRVMLMLGVWFVSLLETKFS